MTIYTSDETRPRRPLVTAEPERTTFLLVGPPGFITAGADRFEVRHGTLQVRLIPLLPVGFGYLFRHVAGSAAHREAAKRIAF